MKRKLKILGLTAILSISVAQPGFAAEIWSDGDWELGQPSNSESPKQKTTELWSETLWPDEQPSSNDATPQENSQPAKSTTSSGTIQLDATLKTELTFTVPPVNQNGTTLVPLRGTLEPLGFTLEWNSKEQTVVIKKATSVVILKINSKSASVNGKNVSLQSPATLINGSVFVPLRFISEATGSKVDWDAATTKVTIDNQYYFFVDRTKKSLASDEQSQTETNFYAGTWEIWVPGGYATTDTKLNGVGSTTITKEYVNGAKGKTLTIKNDGSYTWEVVGGTINGLWQAADNGCILLVKGQMESDWYVEKVDQNQIKIYAWGMTEYGTRIK